MKKIILWIMSLFFLLAGLTFLPSVGGFIFLGLSAFTAPINKLRSAIGKKIPKAVQIIIIIILFFVSIFTVPIEPSNDTSIADSSFGESSFSSLEESEVSALPIVSENESKTESEAESKDESKAESKAESKDESKDESKAESKDEGEAETSKPDESVGEIITTPENSTFEVHFIDVGQADCALVVCDEKTMLIDGGNKGDSSKIYTYLKNQGITHLDYIVGTHAHEDHIGGLPGALNLVESVGKVYCSVTDYDSNAFDDFKKYTEAKGKKLTVPTVGEEFSLGSAKVKILGCDPTADDPNNTSIVLKITYKETSFLFTGDAERDAEQKILDSGYDLSATVLKVGHHGADTSTTYPFLREILPEIAIISVGEGNNYGHPTEEALSRLRDADVKLYRTDMQGDIIAKSDGKTVTFTVAKNADADVFGSIGENSTQSDVSEAPPVTEPSDESKETGGGEYDYIVHKKSKKFHYPSCRHAENMNEENRIYFSCTRDEAISQGYDPCGTCKP